MNFLSCNPSNALNGTIIPSLSLVIKASTYNTTTITIKGSSSSHDSNIDELLVK